MTEVMIQFYRPFRRTSGAESHFTPPSDNTGDCTSCNEIRKRRHHISIFKVMDRSTCCNSCIDGDNMIFTDYIFGHRCGSVWWRFVRGYAGLHPTSSTAVEKSAHSIIDWCADFGAPGGYMSDWPTHFKNGTLRLLAKRLHSPHNSIKPYCPWDNGAIEGLGKEFLSIARDIFSELMEASMFEKRLPYSKLVIWPLSYGYIVSKLFNTRGRTYLHCTHLCHQVLRLPVIFFDWAVTRGRDWGGMCQTQQLTTC